MNKPWKKPKVSGSHRSHRTPGIAVPLSKEKLKIIHI